MSTTDPNEEERRAADTPGAAGGVGGYPGGTGHPGGTGYPGGAGYPGGGGDPGGAGYPGAPGYHGGAPGYGGYGSYQGHAGDYQGSGYQGWAYPGMPAPPEPPKGPHGHARRGLIITAVVALAAGATVGGLLAPSSSPSGTATATSKTALSSSQIASRVDPALVDIASTDSYQQATSYGTGIVLTSNGEVLTNNHVIEGATSIKATDVGNGRTYTAKVVGYDASHDVAVIQLQNASGLTTASLGSSSSVKVGDSVVALGNAEGKGGTPSMATGSVTALDQSITASDELSGTSEQLSGLIESDAPIQAGDSGGALVNAYGQVVAMNTAASSNYQFQGVSQGSGSQTQAFFIPINDAQSIAHQIESGTTSADVHIGATAFLGVGITTQNSPFSQGGSGATVQDTVSGSPAANAGLAQGDQITSIGSTSVSSASDVAKALVPYHPGDSIKITWLDQSGQSHTATVTLATGPAA